MTGAQTSYLKTLCEHAGMPELYNDDLSTRKRYMEASGHEPLRFHDVVSRELYFQAYARRLQLIPATAAVEAAAANEQYNQDDDKEGGCRHGGSSALRSAFEWTGRAYATST
jgi:hypothetical protein